MSRSFKSPISSFSAASSADSGDLDGDDLPIIEAKSASDWAGFARCEGRLDVAGVGDDVISGAVTTCKLSI